MQLWEVGMTTITISNMPEELLRTLQKKAIQEKTSLQEQIIQILDKNLKKSDGFAKALEDFYEEFPIEDNNESEERFDFDALRSKETGRDINL